MTKPNKESMFTKHVAESMKQGALMAAASESNELIKAGVSKALIAAGLPEEALEGALFQKGMPLMSATLILFLAERFPHLIPKSDMVVKAATLALTSATADTLDPILKAVTPTFLALASAGERVAEIEGEVYDEDEVEEETEEEVEEYSDEPFQEAEFSEREIEVTPIDADAKRSGPRGVPTSQAARGRS